MTILTKNVWENVIKSIGFTENVPLLATHLDEIGEESENILELLAVLRADAHRNDTEHAQESAAELTIALEHLLHHIQSLLPSMQQQLDLEP